MKANELRVGNWVSILGLHNGQIETIDFASSYIEGSDYKFKELSPIPLTEEWLEKFGFEKITDTPNIYGRHFYRLNEVEIFWDSDGVGWLPFGLGVGKSVDFKYVHTLQNLYFALTGAELECATS